MASVIEVESTRTSAGGSFLIRASTPEEVFTPEDFSMEYKQIAAMTATFAEERILANSEAIEKKDFPLVRKLLREAGELGLLGVDVPEKYGGVELDKITSTIIAERISVSGSFSIAFGGQVGIGLLPLLWYGTEEQKQKYLPHLVSGESVAAYALSESSAGSDAMNIRTRASLSEDGSHYILDGEKVWITNAAFADLFTVFAKVDGNKFSAFLVDRNTPGLTIGAEEHKLGLRGSSTCSVVLDGCRVPADNLLGQVGKGHHIAFNILNVGRYKLAATGLGAARTALRDGIRYGRERIAFGKPVTSFGLVQEMISDSATRMYALESTLYRVVGAINASLSELDKHSPSYTQEVQKRIEEFVVECSILKVFGSEVLGSVVDKMLQIYGGYGYVEDYPAERSYRDARIHRIFEGTNEINRQIILNWTLKRSSQGGLSLPLAITNALQQAEPARCSSSSSPLAAEDQVVKCARNIALRCTDLSIRRFGEELSEQQEIVGALADIFIQVLAMESCLLRAQKSSYSHLHAKLTSLFVTKSFRIVRDLAELITAASVEGEALEQHMSQLNSLVNYVPVNTVVLARDVAATMVAAGQYAL